MVDHSHDPTAKKVLVAVGGQGIDAETVRLACRMTDPHGGKLYGVHIIEVNRSLPLGAVMDEVVERGEKILDEVRSWPRLPSSRSRLSWYRRVTPARRWWMRPSNGGPT